MQRCTRCVLPQTVPTIEFNNEGVCNFCINFEKKDYLGKDKLDQVIEEVRAKGRRYDCIVPISGGRDSAFALYIACRIYNLKTLAVHFDNDFSTKEAELNVKNACEILGVDYEIVRSK
ncbi:MAG: ATPase, partial [Planctomycetota bacterium]